MIYLRASQPEKVAMLETLPKRHIQSRLVRVLLSCDVMGLWSLLTTGLLLAHPAGWSSVQLAQLGSGFRAKPCRGTISAAMAGPQEVQSMWDLKYIRGKAPCSGGAYLSCDVPAGLPVPRECCPTSKRLPGSARAQSRCQLGRKSIPTSTSSSLALHHSSCDASQQ